MRCAFSNTLTYVYNYNLRLTKRKNKQFKPLFHHACLFETFPFIFIIVPTLSARVEKNNDRMIHIRLNTLSKLMKNLDINRKLLSLNNLISI